jgi:hypothetical protein
MTDAAHRRKGLFARTTEHALARYAERAPGERPVFFFNHSNEFSLPGYRKMGWEFSSTEVRHHRLQRAGSYVADAVGGLPGAVAGRVATALTRGYLDVVDARANFDTGPFAVERFDGHESIPAAEFAACYDACRPAAVHVVYDEPFYEWYFAEPGHEADAAYLVRRGGRPVAGAVLDREHDPRNDTTAVILTVATTGGIHGKETNPNVPEQPEEIAEQARGCEKLGASIVHGRDEHGENSAAHLQQVTEAVREQCEDIIVQHTTGGQTPTRTASRASVPTPFRTWPRSTWARSTGVVTSPPPTPATTSTGSPARCRRKASNPNSRCSTTATSTNSTT